MNAIKLFPNEQQSNPWCEACKEAACRVTADGTCSMIRKYLALTSKPEPKKDPMKIWDIEAPNNQTQTPI